MTGATLPSLPAGAWIILGLLLDGTGPRSGYDLQAQAARSVATFWPITKAHVYSALPRLEAEGLVVGRQVEQRGAPDKRLYGATASAPAALASWLADLGEADPKLRHPLLVAVFFGSAIPPDKLRSLLSRHEERCHSGLSRYATLLARAADAGPGDGSLAFRRLAIRHGMLALEADLAWIGEVRDSIG